MDDKQRKRWKFVMIYQPFDDVTQEKFDDIMVFEYHPPWYKRLVGDRVQTCKFKGTDKLWVEDNGALVSPEMVELLYQWWRDKRWEQVKADGAARGTVF